LLLFFWIVTLAVGCLGFYVLYRNPWPILLCAPVLFFLCAYSYAKRFTKWSHYWLGMALALSTPAAWLAVHPASLGPPVLLLMLAVACWVGGFDIIYACQDIEIDRREGLFSLPSRLGPRKALWIARISHVLAIAGLVALGRVADLGAFYAIGVGAAAVLLIVENSLVTPTNFSRVNLAFFTINGAVSLVVGALAITDVLVSHP
jgi:4-hydroxybenzoate polyprenyltransferase